MGAIWFNVVNTVRINSHSQFSRSGRNVVRLRDSSLRLRMTIENAQNGIGKIDNDNEKHPLWHEQHPCESLCIRGCDDFVCLCRF
jgi:hypothetical protein